MNLTPLLITNTSAKNMKNKILLLNKITHSVFICLGAIELGHLSYSLFVSLEKLYLVTTFYSIPQPDTR